jgi:hypothetical protein
MGFVKCFKFGKYKDVPIEQVPTGYLEWMRDFQLSTVTMVFLELQRRKREERKNEGMESYQTRDKTPHPPFYRGGPESESEQSNFINDTPFDDEKTVDGDDDIPF